MTGRRGWWRRNWWGLAALVPIMVTWVWLTPNEPYQEWRESQPRPVTAGSDGWVDYGAARIRLAGLAPADLRRDDGEPYPMPAGVQVWQGTLVIELGVDPEALLGCDIALEDSAGRQFANGPDEVRGFEVRIGPELDRHRDSCVPPDEDLAAPTFEVLTLFLLPVTATPVAVRLTILDEEPAYAWLEPA